MATIDDVERGVCNALAGVLFPGVAYMDGAVENCSAPWIGSPGAPLLVVPTKLYIGEPVSEGVESDVRAGISEIGVMRIQGATRDVTRYFPEWEAPNINPATLIAAPSNGAVVFGGTGGAGMVAGVTAGRVCYAYRLSANDTPATVTAALAAMIPGGYADGATLTAPEITESQVLADQLAFWCTGMRETLLQVCVLAVPTAASEAPLVRAALTRLVYGLDALRRPDGNVTRWIGLPDGTTAKLTGADERDDDTPKRGDIWRRWIHYRVLYSIGAVEIQPRAMAPMLRINADAQRIFWAGNGAPATGIMTDRAGNVVFDSSPNPMGTFR